MAPSKGKRAKERPSLQEVLARNVAVRREQLGLSQEALGRQCGFHYSYVGRLERGPDDPNPRLTTLEKLAAALGTTVPELLTDQTTAGSN